MASVFNFNSIDFVEPDIRGQFAASFERAVGCACHRKRHTVFVELNSGNDCLCLNLSEVFQWCVSSTTQGERVRVGEHACCVVVKTPLTRCIAFAETVTNAHECERISMVYSADSRSVQLQVLRKSSSKATILVGLTIATPNQCTTCAAMKPLKLKACSRCYRNTGVRVLYCSEKCQHSDYPRHREACAYDWGRDGAL